MADTAVLKWTPNTAYTYLQAVISPNGDVVTAKNNFTSGATYDPSLWNLSSSYGRFLTNGNLYSPKGVQSHTLVVNGSTTPGGTRIPVVFASTIDGSKLTAANPSDKVGHSNTVIFKGGFTGEATNNTPNPGWLWGANDFIVTGTTPGDLAGITTIEARLSELHLNTPAATINDAYGLVGDIGISESAAGLTITGQMASMFLKGPTNNAAANVGTASTLFLSSPLTSAATTTYAINSPGEGKVLINGDIVMNGDPARPKLLNAQHGEIRAKTLTAGAPNDAPTGARIAAKATADNEVVGWFQGRGGQTANILNIGKNTTVFAWFNKNGLLGISGTGEPADTDINPGQLYFYADTTTNAPKLMLKGKDAAGTTFTRSIPLAAQSGTTEQRPTAAAAGIGGQYYDTILTKPIWSDGTIWRDAMGNAV